jgi:hypothetical protein
LESCSDFCCHPGRNALPLSWLLPFPIVSGLVTFLEDHLTVYLRVYLRVSYSFCFISLFVYLCASTILFFLW